ncbi:MAG TPA: hypothetical protein VLH81_01380 [Desulfobacterales bacterium]|nr:hypothetical protein [Desulfobacterales bacterium]
MSSSLRRLPLASDTELLAFHVEAPLPHAPDGAWVYVFVYRSRRVGRWDWCRDEAGLERIAAAYREATARDYEPPEYEAPGGEPALIRPATQDLVARAMDAGRPGPSPLRPPCQIIPQREEP